MSLWHSLGGAQNEFHILVHGLTNEVRGVCPFIARLTQGKTNDTSSSFHIDRLP